MKLLGSFTCLIITLLVGYAVIWMKIINCYFVHSEIVAYWYKDDLLLVLNIAALFIVLIGAIVSFFMVRWDGDEDEENNVLGLISLILFGVISVAQGVTAYFTLEETACGVICFIAALLAGGIGILLYRVFND